MYGDESQQDATQPRIIHEIKLNATSHQQAKPQGLSTTDVLMFLGPVSFIMGWAVLFFMLSKIGRAASDEFLIGIKHLNRVPCRNCQFYSNNVHLKCAVNPSIVMTEQALNCCDYVPHDSKLSQ